MLDESTSERERKEEEKLNFYVQMMIRFDVNGGKEGGRRKFW